MMNECRLTDFLDETTEALRFQLEIDQLRWGDTWRYRPQEGQEERAFARYQDYLDQFRNAGVPIPWLKVMGEALIALVRERHPELSLMEEDSK